MTITLRTVATVAKGFSVKREKADDDTEHVVAHLKFSDAFVERDIIDELLRQPIGWADGALFDEFGAPRGRWTISADRAEFGITGTIEGGTKRTDPRLTLANGATLTDLSVELTKLGGLLSGAIAWEARGDEVEDVHELLGKTCAIEVVLTDGGQQDLLGKAA